MAELGGLFTQVRFRCTLDIRMHMRRNAVCTVSRTTVRMYGAPSSMMLYARVVSVLDIGTFGLRFGFAYALYTTSS